VTTRQYSRSTVRRNSYSSNGARIDLDATSFCGPKRSNGYGACFGKPLVKMPNSEEDLDNDLIPEGLTFVDKGRYDEINEDND